MKVHIKSAEVRVKTGTSAKTGKPWSMRSQECQFECERFRVSGQLTLGDEQPPFPPGTYEVDFDQSVKANAYGEIALARSLVLLPVKAAKAA